MSYWTYLELSTKVRMDLDIQDTNPATAVISPTEMLAYANEGIDRASQEVHTLYEDYFITYSLLDLVSGTEEYALPTDIYAHKIRRIMYRNGSKTYKIGRIPDWHKFEEYTLDRVNGTDTLLSYFLINSVPGEPRILMTPVPRETLTGKIKVWYIRRANTLVLDADILDIPEANNYILQYVKVRCLEKLKDPAIQKAMADLDTEKINLITTLAAMVPDADNEIEADYTSYQEMS